MQINSYTGTGLSSILDYLDDDDDNSIEGLLTSANNLRTTALQQKLSKASSSDSTASENIVTAAQTAAASLEELLSEEDDSVISKAADDSSEVSVTDVVTEVQKFVSGYNTMVKNMSSEGGKINITYLVELGKAYVDNEDALSTIGITRSDDGQLTVDTDKLKASDLESIKAAFQGSDSYASTVNETIAGVSKVTQTTSSMSAAASGVYSSTYNSSAVTTDGVQTLLNSLFNSEA